MAFYNSQRALRDCLNPLLSEAGFSTHAALVEYLRERGMS